MVTLDRSVGMPSRPQTLTESAAPVQCFPGFRRVTSAVVGFTLLELLVVIAIISVLVAMLLPAISAIKHNAKQVVCSSNLRQQALALHGYRADWKNKFPDPINSGRWLMGNLGGISSPTVGYATGLGGLFMAGFLEQQRIAFCSEPGRFFYDPKAPWKTTNNWNGIYAGYAWWAGYRPGTQLTDGQISISVNSTPYNIAMNILSSANTVVSSDLTFDNFNPSGFKANHARGSGPGSRGGNVLHLDGHVEWHAIEAMKIRSILTYNFYF